MFWKIAAASNRKLPAETAHNVAVQAMRLGLVPQTDIAAFPHLQCGFKGLHFGNPIGLAAGFDKNAEAMAGAFKMGLGHIEVGTITPLPQPGNPKPRVFRLVEDGAVINRYGFNSQGMEIAQKRLSGFRGKRAGGIVGVNIGANKNSNDRIADYYHTACKLSPFADYLTINISSPNTAGLRDLQHDSHLKAIIQAAQNGMSDANAACPLMVKLAPDLSKEQLQSCLDGAAEAGINGVILTNTTIARPEFLRSAHKSQTGGLSGAPLQDQALACLEWAASWRKDSGHSDISFIGVGGINSAKDVYVRLLMGAELVQLYTALALQGPELVHQILTDLSILLAADGAKLDQVIGQLSTRGQALEHVQQLVQTHAGYQSAN